MQANSNLICQLSVNNYLHAPKILLQYFTDNYLWPIPGLAIVDTSQLSFSGHLILTLHYHYNQGDYVVKWRAEQRNQMSLERMGRSQKRLTTKKHKYNDATT